MSEFVRVASVSEIPDAGKLLVEVGDRLVVLFHVGGQFYAIDDICTHDDGPLSEGKLCGFEIACPRHGAKFDIRNGKALTMPATKPTASHEVKLVGDGVYVRVREPGDEGSTSETPVTSATPTAAALTASSSTAASSSTPSANTTSSSSAPAEAGAVTEDVCREALKQVIDPELFVNIVDLGLIYVVQVNDKESGKSDVTVEMTMTSPACPAGPQLLQNSKDVLRRVPGVDQVEVKLVMTPPWTPDRMTDSARDQLGIF